MADDPTKTEGDPPEGSKSDTEKAEENFWKKLDGRIDAGIDRAIEKHTKPGGSRTGKLTVPEMFANLLLGEKKS